MIKTMIAILLLSGMNLYAAETPDAQPPVMIDVSQPEDLPHQEQFDLNKEPQFSLKSGDVIKSVNGEPVDSPAKAMELFFGQNPKVLKFSNIGAAIRFISIDERGLPVRQP